MLRRILVAATAVITSLTLIVGFLWWRQNNLWNRIEKVEMAAGTLRSPDGVPAGEPLNFLLVGSDSRAEGDPIDPSAEVGGQRSDVMLLVRVAPRDNTAAFLSVPRDLLVKIADTGKTQRINTAFSNGADNLVQTINQTLGIPIDHYMQIDFTGFSAVVDALNGVKVNFAYPAIDEFSGLQIDNPGCQELNGEQALAFVRSRHFRYFVDGKQKEDPSGDLGRIERQQYLLKQIVRQATAGGATNPVKADKLLSSVVGYLKLDNTLSKASMLDLVRQLKNVGVDNLQSFSLPTDLGSATLGGQRASILRLHQPDADDVISAFLKVGAPAPVTTTTAAATAPTTATTVTQTPQTTQTTVVDKTPAVVAADPAGISALILNGTTSQGLAAKANTKLTAAGMTVPRVGNASTKKYKQTEVHYPAGNEAKAAALADVLGVETKLVLDATVKETDITVILGTDFISAASAGRSVSIRSSAATVQAQVPQSTETVPTTTLPKTPKGMSLEPCS